MTSIIRSATKTSAGPANSELRSCLRSPGQRKLDARPAFEFGEVYWIIRFLLILFGSAPFRSGWAGQSKDRRSARSMSSSNIR